MTVGAVPTVAVSVDRRVLDWIVRSRSSGLVTVARTVSHLGDPVVLVVLAVGAGLLLRRWGRRASEAALPLIALVGGSATEWTLKRVVNRTRPPLAFHLVHESGPSFPSGHTTGAAALFIAVALVASSRLGRGLRRVILAGGAAVAGVVGAARVVLGVHWPSDVLAGWCLGALFAWAAVHVERRRRQVRVASESEARSLGV